MKPEPRTCNFLNIKTAVMILATLFATITAQADNTAVVPETVDADRTEIIDNKRAEIDRKSLETLGALYKAYPDSRDVVSRAVGYAVFNNIGVTIILAGGGTGTGVAINNTTEQRTYMKMVQLEAGLGLGIKRFQAVFVFGTPEVMNDFLNKGWEFGAQATAAAKLDDEGDAFQHAVSVSPGLWVYQLTESGLALEFTGKGTKYFKDDELN